MLEPRVLVTLPDKLVGLMDVDADKFQAAVRSQVRPCFAGHPDLWREFSSLHFRTEKAQTQEV